MPGYPRVSSVPQHSLNCNGYSGEFSGNQQNASQQSQNNPLQQQQQQQPQPQAVQHGMHWKTESNGIRPIESHWKVQTNGTRPMESVSQWKTQTNGVPSTPQQQQQQMPGLDANNKTGHFLSYSHHLRDLNTDGNLNNNNNSSDMCLSSVQSNLNIEPNGGGGVPPHWKSEAKPLDDFQSQQQQQGTFRNKVLFSARMAIYRV